MRVSDLARKADTTAETVRHYTDLGLLTPERNPDNGYRHYGARDLQRLRFALKARSLGFTLGDIGLLVDASENGEAPCAQTRQLIETRLAQVEARIEELHLLKERMRSAMAACSSALLRSCMASKMSFFRTLICCPATLRSWAGIAPSCLSCCVTSPFLPR